MKSLLFPTSVSPSVFNEEWFWLLLHRNGRHLKGMPSILLPPMISVSLSLCPCLWKKVLTDVNPRFLHISHLFYLRTDSFHQACKCFPFFFEFNQLGPLYQHRIKRRSYVFNIEINFLSLWFAQLSMKKLSFMDFIPSSFPNSLRMLGP